MCPTKGKDVRPADEARSILSDPLADWSGSQDARLWKPRFTSWENYAATCAVKFIRPKRPGVSVRRNTKRRPAE